MTLKEKLCEPFGGLRTETANKLEKIADDYAIDFVEWITNEKSKYAIMYGNQEKRFATFRKDYTAKELLEIFKKEKGL